MRFRKKPVVVEAVQFDGTITSVSRLLVLPEYEQDFLSGALTIPTLEGHMTAQIGDWIIKGVKGEFYPCRPDIFAATYERVSDHDPASGDPDAAAAAADRARDQERDEG